MHSAIASSTVKPKTIAFLCSPTGFVAFLSHPSYTSLDPSERPNVTLFEYDRRFALLCPPGRFVYYDLEEGSDNVPDDLKGCIDIAVLDPPFLNEVKRIYTTLPNTAYS